MTRAKRKRLRRQQQSERRWAVVAHLRAGMTSADRVKVARFRAAQVLGPEFVMTFDKLMREHDEGKAAQQ